MQMLLLFILPLWAGFCFHRLQLALSCASSLSCRWSVIPSLVSSNQLSNIFLGLPLLFFPGSHPSNTVLINESWRNTCPNHLFCLFLNVSRSSLLVSTALSTSSFFLCSVQAIDPQHATPNPHFKCLQPFYITLLQCAQSRYNVSFRNFYVTIRISKITISVSYIHLLEATKTTVRCSDRLTKL